MQNQKEIFECDHGENYSVEKESVVPFESRSSNFESKLEYAPVNGGLYNKKSDCGPVHVIPTTTNYILNHLKSANPPPGAMEQIVGTNRLGNNYIAMPNVKWLKDTDKKNCGPFNIVGV